MRRTKIVCTLGPAVDDPKMLEKLILSGMDIARINLSHGNHEEHLKRIVSLRMLSRKFNRYIPIMLDTKGPEIRVGHFENGFINLVEGEQFILTSSSIVGNQERVSITYPLLPNELTKGDRIFLDDGLLELEVLRIDANDIVCKVISGGHLSTKKAVNIPGKHLNLPSLSDVDKKDIIFAIKNDIEIIAPSFVRSASDISDLREFLAENNVERKILIVAKIENLEGMQNVKAILEVSDGIMVARGDMGVELPAEDVPIMQKQIIGLCRNAGKPVITATQMLDSMIRNPHPTRAEVSDVANAVLDGTDAIMLSGETAAGKHPIESLITMAKVAERAETSDVFTDNIMAFKKMIATNNVTDVIGHATVQIATELNASAIITSTQSGTTARMVAKYRPRTPIVAVTVSNYTASQLNLFWGVTPLAARASKDTDDMIDMAVNSAKEASLVKCNDTVVITAGVPVGIPGTTNIIKVHEVE